VFISTPPQTRAKVHNDTYNGGYQGDDSADTGGDDGNDGFKGGSSKPRQRHSAPAKIALK